MMLPFIAAMLFPAIFVLFGFLAAGVFFALWLWALIDCLGGDFKGNDKIAWLLVVIFVPLVGSILYFFIGRGQKIPPGGTGLR
jgi:hypothetical protein